MAGSICLLYVGMLHCCCTLVTHMPPNKAAALQQAARLTAGLSCTSCTFVFTGPAPIIGLYTTMSQLHLTLGINSLATENVRALFTWW